jgi:basic membrane lipoprotein Med (substrate-binding protein (PBP1-ABC) superfamily)
MIIRSRRGGPVRHRSLRPFAASVAALAVAACGSREAKEPAPRAAAPAFTVALLTPGPISDAGWNAGAYDGLQAIGRELGAGVSHVQVKSPSEFEEQFRAYAAKGTTLVFGHGFEFQDAAERVAKEYPKTVFVTTSGSRTAPNLAPIVFELEQAAYLCGLMAGRMSKTGKAGIVGGVELPSITSTFLAFEGGFRAANPSGTATAVFTGSFEDVAGAKAASLALADRGADFLFQNADAAALGVFKAAEERKIAAFGANKDQNALSPAVVASAVIDMARAYVETARRVKAGAFDGKPLRYGLASGVVSFVISPSARVPQPVRDELKAAEEKIRSGALAVPRGNF